MKRIILLINLLGLLIFSCDPLGEADLKLGPPPSSEDAAFTFEVSDENDNIIHFSNTSPAFLKTWDFGNGTSAKGNNVTGIFPLKGTYEVTLTVYTSGGSSVSKQTIEIAETDPTLLDLPVYNMLTGGNDKPEGKTWIIDASRAGHFGVGPNPSDPAVGDYPNWYAAAANEKAGSGLYNDEFTFILADFAFKQETNGDVFLNNKYSSEFSGAYANAGDYTAPYTAPGSLTWSVTEGGDGNQYLNISGDGFIGYYTAVHSYKIVKLTENEMILRSEDANDAALAWYQRLIPKDYTPPVPEPQTTTLPVTFENVQSPFTGFGGSNYAVVDNPTVAGINTSAKVGQTAKGAETWAGIATDLDETLDFSLTTTFRLKVLSPKTGVVRLKIEMLSDANTFVEKDANITQANQWEELTFDFSGTASNTYNKLALFFDFGSTEQNTFYFDDVELIAAQCEDADNESLSAVAGLNFTMGTTTFGQFGNIASEKVENPHKEGINTSCYVNSYQKTGGCETWSGVAYSLANAIDFATATKKKFKMKVYAVNQTTDVTLRLERLPFPDTEPSADRVATITATGEWQELTFDFSDITDPNTYKNIIVYFERNATCDGDLYYFDDLRQIE